MGVAVSDLNTAKDALAVLSKHTGVPAQKLLALTAEELHACALKIDGIDVFALAERAGKMGIAEADVEKAVEGQHGAGAVLELMLHKVREQKETEPNTGVMSELESMSILALGKKARACAGIDKQQVNEAMEAEDKKAAIIELIVGAEVGAEEVDGGAAAPSAPKLDPALASEKAADIHSAGSHAGQCAPPERSAFLSLRFGEDHGAQVKAEELQAALKRKGVDAKIINMKAGGNIKQEVFSQIEYCSTFIAFGSKHYGEDTGNSASTYKESMYVENLKGDKKKKIILIRMIPFDEEFEHLQGRTFFGMNDLELPWMLGKPMPPNLADEIIKGMGPEATATTALAPALTPAQAGYTATQQVDGGAAMVVKNAKAMRNQEQMMAQIDPAAKKQMDSVSDV